MKAQMPTLSACPAARLPFSRTLESEADKMGLYFLAMAGYDKHESADFWKRMKSMTGGGVPPEFMSTRPAHDTRISDIEDMDARGHEVLQWGPEVTGITARFAKKAQ